MDASFDLKSSMSPKITKTSGSINKKPPTRLALKKYFRKSLGPVVMSNSMNNESIITISSSSETCSSSDSEKTPVIILDSEESFNMKQLTVKTPSKPIIEAKDKDCNQLSKEKYNNIKQWLNEIDTEFEESRFSEMSAIQKDENYQIKKTTKVAISSTLIESSSRRFDELFKKHENKSREADQQCESNLKNFSSKVIDDSLLTEDNSKENEVDKLEDSFSHLILNESLNSRLNKKSSEECSKKLDFSEKNYDTSEYENVLDSLYGDSWREKQDEILPQSEPRRKNPDTQISKKLLKTEKATKSLFNDTENNSNNLLKTLQKARFKRALESPWIKSLKNLCDSDSDDDVGNNLAPIKLNFNDDEDDRCNKVTPDNKNTEKESTKTKLKTASQIKIKSQENKSVKRCYTFLASLSKDVPMSKCDMSAWIYRNSFKENKEQLAAKLFKLYNENIFENAVPADTPLQWNDRMRGTAGYCYCRKITRRTGAIERAARIVLSTKVLDSADRVRDTLIHEMCHAATWIVNQVADGHGSFWKSWADRAMKIFPELPPIKRCHQYVINTKYTYKCTGCGYSIGRHSKSLNTERKKCGYCYGTFEVFINKTNKNGETKSVPATPKRKPNGFAKFVKENYATYKTSDLKHAEVMKILGQKFSEMKCD